jgi:O-antigen ligase
MFNQNAPVWLNRIYSALFLLMPWSVDVSFGNWNLNCPSEPLMLVAGGLLLWEVVRHPAAATALFGSNRVVLLAGCWIAWMGICACFSSMPVVSWKYWIAESGQWWVFAGGMTLFPGLWRRVIPLFTASLAAAAVYTLIHHAGYHFRADQALLAPMPFFSGNNEHAAILALALPWVLAWPGRYRTVLPAILLTGIALSFCRAAVVSLLVSGVVAGCWYSRRYWRFMALGGGLMVMAGVAFRQPILDAVRQRTGADVSTMERLNRYACAARMVAERPMTGFGPGTFAFQYIPFQQPAEMTRISVQAPVLKRSPDNYGRGGGAHSEYWQALSECGWPGLLLFIAWIMAFLWKTGVLLFKTTDRTGQWFLLVGLASMGTFIIHGTVNNLLHDGRIAALVWGMLALDFRLLAMPNLQKRAL